MNQLYQIGMLIFAFYNTCLIYAILIELENTHPEELLASLTKWKVFNLGVQTLTAINMFS